MRVALLVGFVVLLAACAQQIVWVKPGVTQTEFLRDEYECRHAVAMIPPRPAAEAGKRGGFFGGLAEGLQAGEEEERAERLYLLCMMGRGYRQQE
jgi:hypothetical protein